MTITITKHQAIELLDRAVSERGETYIDPNAEHDSCSYFINGKPGCIVGLALHFAGVNNETLREWDANVSGLSAIGLTADQDSITLEGVVLEREAFIAWQAAQAKQDKGKTWGEALAEAKNALSAQASTA